MIAKIGADVIVVVARVEAPGDLGFSVRVGYRRPIVHSTSGIVLYAFQPRHIKTQWRLRLGATETERVWQTFEDTADTAFELGHAQRQSERVSAVTDISCPIFSDAGVAAALTMPHLQSDHSADLRSSLEALKAIARTLSDDLGGR